MKKYTTVFLDFDGQPPVEMESCLSDGKPAVMFSVGKWQDEHGGDDGENILLSIEEFESFIIQCEAFLNVVKHEQCGGD
jgi:hypothetical protein